MKKVSPARLPQQAFDGSYSNLKTQPHPRGSAYDLRGRGAPPACASAQPERGKNDSGPATGEVIPQPALTS